MQCEHVQNELAAYAGGRLPAEKEAEIASHLATCDICSEEAAFMSEFGTRISSGLQTWVAQGAVPPDLMAQIEESVRASRRKPWWQRWPAYAGVAAALMVIILGARADLSGQLASLPLVGTVVSQIFRGDTTELFPATGIADEKNGLTLVLLQSASADGNLRIDYLVRGSKLDALADQSRFRPILITGGQEVPLRDLSASRGKHEVRLTAFFDPVPAGQELQLELTTLPIREPGTGLNSGRQQLVEGPWQLNFQP